MKPVVAISELEKLCAEAQAADRFYQKGSEFKAWRARVRVVLRAAFGEEDVSTKDFDDVRYTIGVWSGAPGEAERDARYHQKAVGNRRRRPGGCRLPPEARSRQRSLRMT